MKGARVMGRPLKRRSLKIRKLSNRQEGKMRSIENKTSNFTEMAILDVKLAIKIKIKFTKNGFDKISKARLRIDIIRSPIRKL